MPSSKNASLYGKENRMIAGRGLKPKQIETQRTKGRNA
jgi:hypothetical protein